MKFHMTEHNLKSNSGVQSVDRAFDLLECLSSEKGGRRLTDISEELGLHKSTVHRLLNAMQQRGYVEKEDRNYKLGIKFINLSSQLLNSIELKTEAEPYLRNLSDETGQTVFLAIREGNEVVYIDKVEQYNSLRRYSIIGTRAPLYCTSLGRALLLDESEQSLKVLFKEIELKSLTKETLVSRKKLILKIETFRNRGWTEEVEEFQEGIRCAGAPVKDYRNKIAAAVSTAWNVRKTEIDPDLTGPHGEKNSGSDI